MADFKCFAAAAMVQAAVLCSTVVAVECASCQPEGALQGPYNADGAFCKYCGDHGILDLAKHELTMGFWNAGEMGPAKDYRVWGRAEYLLFWGKSAMAPPLVTTGPAQFPVGFLNDPNTVVLYGGSGLDNPAFSGANFMIGFWLKDPSCNDHPCAFEMNGFFLGENTQGPTFSSTLTPVLARPFFNVNQGIPFSEVAAFPGISQGIIGVPFSTGVWGLAPNVIHPLWSTCCDTGCSPRSSSTDLITGFRFLSLNDDLQIIEGGQISNSDQFPDLAGRRFLVQDRFGTGNQFYGGQIGLRHEQRRGRWFANLRGLLGLGATHQTISIDGRQVLIDRQNNVSTFQGGLLALPSNMGRYTRDNFAFVPEIGLNFGMYLTPRLRAYLGYTFIYWSNVARAGDQVDLALDVNQIPNFNIGPVPPAPQARPRVPFDQTDYWLQGINFGMELFW